MLLEGPSSLLNYRSVNVEVPLSLPSPRCMDIASRFLLPNPLGFVFLPYSLLLSYGASTGH